MLAGMAGRSTVAGGVAGELTTMADGGSTGVGGVAGTMRGVCCPGGVTAGTGTSFCDDTGRTGRAAPRGLGGAPSASLRFSSSLNAWYCSHLSRRSSAGTRLTSANVRRAWARCWLLSAAHSIMRLCSVTWSSAGMFA
ncbi:hypothetical protein FQZ97_529100 [compost metagenome]